MILFLAYALLLLFAAIWIANDDETAQIFNVYGRNFRYAFFESGIGRKIAWVYGWRLALLVTVVLLCGLIAHRIYVLNPFDLSPGVRLLVFVILLTSAFLPLPWINLADRIRWWRRMRMIAARLAAGFPGSDLGADFRQTLDRADYNIAAPWSAWHPKLPVWQAGGLWQDLVPVVYLRDDAEPAALFPVDWYTFLAWKVPAAYVELRRDLPVRGPGNVTFKVKAVRPLRNYPDWCVVETDMNFPQVDELIEGAT